MTHTDRSRDTALSVVEFVIGGMTCASCAVRVEKSLNTFDGVSACVNDALESAKVSKAEHVNVEELITTIQDAGETATRPAPPGGAAEPVSAASPGPGDAVDALGERPVISAVLTVPVLLLAMVPPAQTVAARSGKAAVQRLAEGHRSLIGVVPAQGVDQTPARGLAATLENPSEHPIAAEARDRRLHLGHVDDFQNVPGRGVRGTIAGRDVYAGRAGWLVERDTTLSVELTAALDRAEGVGKTAVAVGWDGAARALHVVPDTIRTTSVEAIDQLRSLGLTPILLTGDNSRTAAAVAAELGISDVIAGVLPEEKVTEIARLQREGHVARWSVMA